MLDKKFELVSDFQPQGDQPVAIETLVDSINAGNRHQTLLGATGTGKTFTMAQTIARVGKPALIIAHNKVLAAQLYDEFKQFFPNNSVEYFVSYYNHFQPEVYIPHSDTFIEKDASINNEIDQMRHSATSNLFERKDVIVIASVSAIYGLGDPTEYKELLVHLRVGQEKSRNHVLRELISIRYERNDIDFARGKFRVRGDVVEIFPASLYEKAIRVEFFGDEIEKISDIDPLTGKAVGERNDVSIFPSSHFVTRAENLERACVGIQAELDERVEWFKDNHKLVEAQRIEQRTKHDIESIRELGFCPGIENYSAPLTFRGSGSTPYSLLDYFPGDYITIIDESHVTLPQITGMYAGDRSRKQTLVDHGFRLPSAMDNRPLKFEEFEQKTRQILYVSATPAKYELENSTVVAQQIIRPTGLVDPIVHIRPSMGQIDDLIGEIRDQVEKKERVLILTLTKHMSEQLTEYLKELGIKVKYMHGDIKTIDRLHILRDLRLGKFDVLVGINLLREGIDLPEVSLVAILDADKEGLFRSESSLVQIIGRAARNSNGRVVMYADQMTAAMQRAIDETDRRRTIQMEYNELYGITPQTIQKKIHDVVEATKLVKKKSLVDEMEETAGVMSMKERVAMIKKLEKEMKEAAKNQDFDKAIELRDAVVELKILTV
jgi:excinuclease ABC subunit B